MWVIKKRFGRQIPVPELFGWRVHQGTVFIYMELIPGVTLQERWSDLNFSDKASICERLCQMISSLRQFQHESDDKFIGKPEINNSKPFLKLTKRSQDLLPGAHRLTESFMIAQRLDLLMISKTSTIGLNGFLNDS